MKKMKVPRGTKRALRRGNAQTCAAQYGVPQKFFREFWKRGATADAAIIVLKEAK